MQRRPCKLPSSSAEHCILYNQLLCTQNRHQRNVNGAEERSRSLWRTALISSSSGESPEQRAARQRVLHRHYVRVDPRRWRDHPGGCAQRSSLHVQHWWIRLRELPPQCTYHRRLIQGRKAGTSMRKQDKTQKLCAGVATVYIRLV